MSLVVKERDHAAPRIEGLDAEEAAARVERLLGTVEVGGEAPLRAPTPVTAPPAHTILYQGMPASEGKICDTT